MKGGGWCKLFDVVFLMALLCLFFDYGFFGEEKFKSLVEFFLLFCCQWKLIFFLKKIPHLFTTHFIVLPRTLFMSFSLRDNVSVLKQFFFVFSSQG